MVVCGCRVLDERTCQLSMNCRRTESLQQKVGGVHDEECMVHGGACMPCIG